MELLPPLLRRWIVPVTMLTFGLYYFTTMQSMFAIAKANVEEAVILTAPRKTDEYRRQQGCFCVYVCLKMFSKCF